MRQQVGGQYVFHFDVNLKRLGICIQLFKSRLFLLRDNIFIHGALSDFKLEWVSLKKSYFVFSLLENNVAIQYLNRFKLSVLKVAGQP